MLGGMALAGMMFLNIPHSFNQLKPGYVDSVLSCAVDDLTARRPFYDLVMQRYQEAGIDAIPGAKLYSLYS